MLPFTQLCRWHGWKCGHSPWWDLIKHLTTKAWLTVKTSPCRIFLSHHPGMCPVFVHSHKGHRRGAWRWWSDIASSHMQMSVHRQLRPLDMVHYALLLPTWCTSYSASAYRIFQIHPQIIFSLFYLHGSHVYGSGRILQLGISIKLHQGPSFYINTGSHRNTPTAAGWIAGWVHVLVNDCGW